ncbi:MAG: hypothetical protein ACK559_07020, partial [bacterium]
MIGPCRLCHSCPLLLSGLRRLGFLSGCALGGRERFGSLEDILWPVHPHCLLQCLVSLLVLLTLLLQ